MTCQNGVGRQVPTSTRGENDTLGVGGGEVGEVGEVGKKRQKKPVSEREWVLKLEKSALKANRVVREPQKSIPSIRPVEREGSVSVEREGSVYDR